MEQQKLHDPEYFNKLKESQKKRFKDRELIINVLELDNKWKEIKYNIDQLRKKLNDIQKQITAKKKKCEGVEEELTIKNALDKEIKRIEIEEKISKKNFENMFWEIGNIVHESVPVSDDEKDNVIEKVWGETTTLTLRKKHHELLKLIDGYAPNEGASISGHRGYFLKNIGVKLNQALINYSLDFLEMRGFTLLQTPYFMNKDVMSKTAQLSDYDEQLYKITDGEDEKYLIATSEQPISAFHMNQWLPGSKLPFKYCGYSTNFRKEAGGHGKDVLGIFRVHQFEKVEQFVITTPETSWLMFEELRRNAEEFYQTLNLPYRVVNIVSGELNNAASKKYDIEIYFPGLDEYKELVSCSNCTDYQSRRLNIKTDGNKYVHMLNSTLCATSRTLCAILENYQTNAGINIPDVLQPYLGGKKFIQFL